MRLSRAITAAAVVGVLAVALVASGMGAPAPRAHAASSITALDPALRRLFPLVERFEACTDSAFAQGASAAAAGGSVNVNVTFSIRSQAPAGTPIPIYRFYSPKSGTHFYTPSATERDMVIARYPTVWSFEGIAYWVNPAKNNQSLFRFYNIRVGSHFYTASEAERDRVRAQLSAIYVYDGPTYSVTPYPEAGKTPVYRFYNVKNGSHFYTADPAERDNVVRTLSSIYNLEGIGFWLGQ